MKKNNQSKPKKILAILKLDSHDFFQAALPTSLVPPMEQPPVLPGPVLPDPVADDFSWESKGPTPMPPGPP